MAETIVVTRTERAAAQARVKIDLAHGRTTPWSIVKIANARPAVADLPAEPAPEQPAR